MDTNEHETVFGEKVGYAVAQCWVVSAKLSVRGSQLSKNKSFVSIRVHLWSKKEREPRMDTNEHEIVFGG